MSFSISALPTPSTSEERNEQVMGSSQIATNRTTSREMDRTSSDNIEQNNSRGHTSSHENHQNASREINVPIPTDPNDIIFENEDLKLYVERGNQIFNLK